MSAKAIKKIDEHIESDEVEEIILDEIEIQEISAELKKKLESVKDLSILSMNNCALKSLANFPNLPKLVRLELMNNDFPASELKHLTGLRELQSLSISDNNIKTVDDLKVLKDLPLAQLDVSGTELAEQEGYHDKVFSLFKELQILDNKDKEGKEVEYEDDDEENDYNDEDEEDDEDDFEGEEDDEEEEFDDDEEEEEYDDEEDDDDEDEESNKRTKK